MDLAESKRALACVFAEKGNLTDAQVPGSMSMLMSSVAFSDGIGCGFHQKKYEEALRDVTAVLGREHPRSLAVRAALAGLLRGEEAFIASQSLYH